MQVTLILFVLENGLCIGTQALVFLTLRNHLWPALKRDKRTKVSWPLLALSACSLFSLPPALLFVCDDVYESNGGHRNHLMHHLVKYFRGNMSQRIMHMDQSQGGSVDCVNTISS